MAKELPYFQFEPAEYMAGNIQFCSLESQGLFINICAIYWQRNCELNTEQINKKFDKKSLLDELIENKIIKLKKNIICIEFLDLQFNKISGSKSILSAAGKKGALKKQQARLKPPLSHPEATLKQLDKIREDKIRLDEIRLDEIKEDKIKPEKFFDEVLELPYIIVDNVKIYGNDRDIESGGMSDFAIQKHKEDVEYKKTIKYGK